MELPPGVKMTPMLKQYSEWKDKYPGCLLMFRMGDFFEMFFDDAVTASKTLNITLTARDPEKAIPMAGVPHHALESYLGRLIKAGFRVAICDQMAEPDGRSIVEREVVRVVTPGTYTPERAEDDGRLAAMTFGRDTASVALLSPGVGRLTAGSFGLAEAVSIVTSFEPWELLVPAGMEAEAARLFELTGAPFARSGAIVARERREFEPLSASARLCARWGVASLKAMGVDDADEAAGAASAALRYLEETQFADGAHIGELTPLHSAGMMILDHTTQANLELVSGEGQTLLSVLDRCRTQAGRRMLREWIARPTLDLDEIASRLDCVEAFTQNPDLMRKMADALSKCGDAEHALGKLSLRSGGPKELGVVRDTLAALPGVVEAASALPLTEAIFADLPDISDISGLLSRALADELPRALSAGGVIRDGYDDELDALRETIARGEENFKEFEREERERTGIKLRVAENRVFGYFIEVGKNYADRVPDDYIRRQTVANGERFVTERLKEIERRVYRAAEEIGEREAGLFRELVRAALEASGRCHAAAAAIARADALRSLAEAARDNRYVRPVMDDSRVFSVKGARHPVVERSMGSAAFTPNDIDLDPDGSAAIAILTGPNMAGKSTYLRTAALVAVMAHIGSFVPAESARIGRIDRIFTRIGARDELLRGRSTFMVEMVETANILRNATGRSLVVLDEVGRGTSTYDGMSIAWAVVEFLGLHIEGRAKALFATHYHELTNLAMPMLKNLSMAVDESADGIKFLHKVAEGPADRSYGVEVAKLAGVPSLVVKRARELLEELERERAGSGGRLSDMSKKYAQREIIFDADREGVLERLAACDPDAMTPMEALSLVFELRRKSRAILGLDG